MSPRHATFEPSSAQGRTREDFARHVASEEVRTPRCLLAGAAEAPVVYGGVQDVLRLK